MHLRKLINSLASSSSNSNSTSNPNVESGALLTPSTQAPVNHNRQTGESQIALASQGNHAGQKHKLFGYLHENLMLKCTAEILKKPPRERTAQDIKMVEKSCSHVSFFSEHIEYLGAIVRSECCKAMKYRKVPANSFLIRARERVDELYIIFSGRVSQSKGKFPPRTSVNWSLAGQMVSLPNQEFLTHSSSEQDLITVDECVCGVITYKDFDAILESTSNKSVLTDLTNLAHISFFSRWKLPLLKGILACSRILDCRIHSQIYSIGASPDSWYIVIEGEFSVNSVLSDGDFAQQCGEDRFSSSEEAGTFVDKKGKAQEVSLSILQKNEFFGIEDIVMTQRNREYLVRCVSESGKLRVISAKDTFRLISKNPSMLIDFKSVTPARDAFFAARLSQVRDMRMQSYCHRLHAQLSRTTSNSRKLLFTQSPQSSASMLNLNSSIQQWNSMMGEQSVVTTTSTTNTWRQQETQESYQSGTKAVGQYKDSLCKDEKSVDMIQSPLQVFSQLSSRKNHRVMNKCKVAIPEPNKSNRGIHSKEKQELLEFYRFNLIREAEANKANKQKLGRNSRVEFYLENVIKPMQEQQRLKTVESQHQRTTSEMNQTNNVNSSRLSTSQSPRTLFTLLNNSNSQSSSPKLLNYSSPNRPYLLNFTSSCDQQQQQQPFLFDNFMLLDSQNTCFFDEVIGSNLTKEHSSGDPFRRIYQKSKTKSILNLSSNKSNLNSNSEVKRDGSMAQSPRNGKSFKIFKTSAQVTHTPSFESSKLSQQLLTPLFSDTSSNAAAAISSPKFVLKQIQLKSVKPSQSQPIIFLNARTQMRLLDEKIQNISDSYYNKLATKLYPS